MSQNNTLGELKKGRAYIIVAKSNAQKFRILDKVRVMNGLGYPETQFIIQAVRFNTHVKMYMYYGTSTIFAYEDELELIF